MDNVRVQQLRSAPSRTEFSAYSATSTNFPCSEPTGRDTPSGTSWPPWRAHCRLAWIERVSTTSVEANVSEIAGRLASKSALRLAAIRVAPSFFLPDVSCAPAQTHLPHPGPPDDAQWSWPWSERWAAKQPAWPAQDLSSARSACDLP